MRFFHVGATAAVAVRVGAATLAAFPSAVSEAVLQADAKQDTDECSNLQLLQLSRQANGLGAVTQSSPERTADARQINKDTMKELGYGSCSLSDSECNLKDLEGPTLVYPGGDTECLHGDDYAFAVTPGDTDKLLYMFQGGGACWEANGAFGKQVIMQCTPDLQSAVVTSGSGHGVQNRARSDNPFRSYTVVELLYCSGDAFMGDTILEAGNSTFKQKGYANAAAALAWTKTNVVGELSSLAVTGFSAGSLGTMSWSETVLGMFQYKSAAVLFDSYAGLFPEGAQAPTVKRWGSCDTGLMTDTLASRCRDGTFTIQDAALSAMMKFPSVPFASIQSKADTSQIWFYQGMAQSWGMMEDMQITPTDFYRDANLVLEEWARAAPNYCAFVVNGGKHVYTDSPDFFTATALGIEVPEGISVKTAGPPLVTWVGELITGKKPASVCLGKQSANGAGDISYCSESLSTALAARPAVRNDATDAEQAEAPEQSPANLPSQGNEAAEQGDVPPVIDASPEVRTTESTDDAGNPSVDPVQAAADPIVTAEQVVTAAEQVVTAAEQRNAEKVVNPAVYPGEDAESASPPQV